MWCTGTILLSGTGSRDGSAERTARSDASSGESVVSYAPPFSGASYCVARGMGRRRSLRATTRHGRNDAGGAELAISRDAFFDIAGHVNRATNTSHLARSAFGRGAHPAAARGASNTTGSHRFFDLKGRGVTTSLPHDVQKRLIGLAGVLLLVLLMGRTSLCEAETLEGPSMPRVHIFGSPAQSPILMGRFGISSGPGFVSSSKSLSDREDKGEDDDDDEDETVPETIRFGIHLTGPHEFDVANPTHRPISPPTDNIKNSPSAISRNWLRNFILALQRRRREQLDDQQSGMKRSQLLSTSGGGGKSDTPRLSKALSSGGDGFPILKPLSSRNFLNARSHHRTIDTSRPLFGGAKSSSSLKTGAAVAGTALITSHQLSGGGSPLSQRAAVSSGKAIEGRYVRGSDGNFRPVQHRTFTWGPKATSMTVLHHPTDEDSSSSSFSSSPPPTLGGTALLKHIFSRFHHRRDRDETDRESSGKTFKSLSKGSGDDETDRGSSGKTFKSLSKGSGDDETNRESSGKTFKSLSNGSGGSGGTPGLHSGILRLVRRFFRKFRRDHGKTDRESSEKTFKSLSKGSGGSDGTPGLPVSPMHMEDEDEAERKPFLIPQLKMNLVNPRRNIIEKRLAEVSGDVREALKNSPQMHRKLNAILKHDGALIKEIYSTMQELKRLPPPDEYSKEDKIEETMTLLRETLMKNMSMAQLFIKIFPKKATMEALGDFIRNLDVDKA